MSNYFKKVDAFAASMTTWVIGHRWMVLVLGLVLAITAGYGASRLEMSSNYRDFFSEANPELQAFEELQATYTKNDNFLFVFEPRNGDAFSAETLYAIEQLTEEAWNTPYAIRVDSVTNFQHSYGVDDELIVEDLFKNTHTRSQEFIETRKSVALNEPLLKNLLVSPNAEVSAVNVVLQYPEKDLSEIPEAVKFARGLVAKYEASHPDIEIHLTGFSMLNNAFVEAGMTDGATLTPLMFLVILVLTWIIVRSVAATLATLLIIVLSSVVGMGLAGYFGVKLTPVSMTAPTVIMTLAVADSIHILLSLRSLMREGMDKISALVEAVRINFLPVSITSITTIVGFLALNFSDSPPYWHLGNITAVGIAAAWFYSLTLLPAALSVLPYRVKKSDQAEWSLRMMDKLADFVITQYKKLFVVMGAGALAIISFIPSLEFNDLWVEYFDESMEFRRDSDRVQHHFGTFPMEFSVPATSPGGISEPEYLQYIDNFVSFLRQHEHVTHVYSLSDIMKRLNRNMHGDDPDYYRLPEDRELSAQYLLLYEISLPYGLDLNDRINIDKSATRVTVTLSRISSAEMQAFYAEIQSWQRANWPEHMLTNPTSAAVMFSYISKRNLENMITGTILAVLAIALIMIFALQSLRLGILSLIPNGLPILTTFGTWALLVGHVGFSIAIVASISLGIIVDDTVHFLSKYVRARNERALSIEDSIRYAFRNVGNAIVVNTIILSAGFFVMTYSAFKMNVDMGFMTVFGIIFALILDFLFLPALLLLGKRGQKEPDNTAQIETAGSTAAS